MKRLVGKNEILDRPTLIFDRSDQSELSQYNLLEMGVKELTGDNKNYFEDAKQVFSEQDFKRLIRECQLCKIPVFESYKDENGLPVFFVTGKNFDKIYFVIYSFGEFQPSRYKCYLIGRYEIEEDNVKR